MFVVCLEKRAWYSSEHATYSEATEFQTREMRPDTSGIPTRPRYARIGTMGRR